MAKRICSVEGCERLGTRRGWCGMHYRRWLEHGDPLFVLAVRGDLHARLEAHIDRDSAAPCWLWTGAVGTNGYGRVAIGPTGSRRNLLAHRVVYEWLVGPIPEGETLDHECHNRDASCSGGVCRHRRCVNPAHLIPRSIADNLTASGKSFTAKNALKTHCPRGHPYDEANTRWYRGHRSCRECARASCAKSRAKRGKG